MIGSVLLDFNILKNPIFT
jgi:hypothetical protein